MKKWLLSCLMVNVLGFAQAQKFRIDKINSDATALSQIKSYLRNDQQFDWSTFQFVNGTEWQKSYNYSLDFAKKYAQQRGYSKWKITNLNNDGVPDFVCNGFTLNDKVPIYHALAFVSEKKNEYLIYDLMNGNMNAFPTYYSIIGPASTDTSKSDRIVLDSWMADVNFPNPQNLPLRVDTVLFHQNVFLNYSSAHDTSTISSIQYELINESTSERSRLLFSGLQTGRKGRFELVAYDGKDSVIQRGGILQNVYQHPIDLLHYMNFPKYKSFYSSNDGAPELITRVTVMYQNGTVKSVTDQTKDADFSLDALYGFMENVSSEISQAIYQRRTQWTQPVDDMYNNMY